MSPEQLADLSALQGMAAETAPKPEVEAAPAVDPAETWGIIPAMLGSALAIAMPELRAVYSPEACRAWGAAMVPVADKYGWNADGLLGPELGLLAASLPFAIGTVAAVKAKKAEALRDARRESPQKAGEVQQEGPENKQVIIGAPVAA